MPKYQDYQEEIKQDVSQIMAKMSCQPILFLGSGLSKRYFGGPNWDELLQHLCSKCPEIEKEYAYYKQTYRDPVKVGSLFADAYCEWAWGEGRSQFPPELFKADQPRESYIKYETAKHFEDISPLSLDSIEDVSLLKEIKLIQRIQPHAVITTNYDRFLEVIFPDYYPVIGEEILRTNFVSVGEIFKIHGCTSAPAGIVLTENDYKDFINKRKYLSAKLLTYFAEHPLLFAGYSATDPNI